MPINEIEYHPYLQDGYVPNSKKLILGSFPVYVVTEPDSSLKQKGRADSGAFCFFYGSTYSSFWDLYKTHIDQSLGVPFNPIELKESIRKEGISISDLYKSASRKEHSASDRDLGNKTLNISQLSSYLDESVERVLCTSKYVLEVFSNQCLASKGFAFKKEESDEFAKTILNELGGESNEIVNPICGVYEKGSRQIKLLAMPSPGSFQRSVQHFGWVKGNKVEYGQRYFKAAFNWLIK